MAAGVSCHGAWQALEASAPLGTAPCRAGAHCGSPGLSAWLPSTESGENHVVVRYSITQVFKSVWTNTISHLVDGRLKQCL